jgi:hypothetical protein
LTCNTLAVWEIIPTFGRSDSVLKAGAGVIHF